MMKKKDFWVAIEDTATGEVTPFERADDEDTLDLMWGYKADISIPERFRVREMEGSKYVIYDGVIYKGGFGYNIWIAHKYLEQVEM